MYKDIYAAIVYYYRTDTMNYYLELVDRLTAINEVFHLNFFNGKVKLQTFSKYSRVIGLLEESLTLESYIPESSYIELSATLSEIETKVLEVHNRA